MGIFNRKDRQTSGLMTGLGSHAKETWQSTIDERVYVVSDEDAFIFDAVTGKLVRPAHPDLYYQDEQGRRKPDFLGRVAAWVRDHPAVALLPVGLLLGGLVAGCAPHPSGATPTPTGPDAHPTLGPTPDSFPTIVPTYIAPPPPTSTSIALAREALQIALGLGGASQFRFESISALDGQEVGPLIEGDRIDLVGLGIPLVEDGGAVSATEGDRIGVISTLPSECQGEKVGPNDFELGERVITLTNRVGQQCFVPAHLESPMACQECLPAILPDLDGSHGGNFSLQWIRAENGAGTVFSETAAPVFLTRQEMFRTLGDQIIDLPAIPSEAAAVVGEDIGLGRLRSGDFALVDLSTRQVVPGWRYDREANAFVAVPVCEMPADVPQLGNLEVRQDEECGIQFWDNGGTPDTTTDDIHVGDWRDGRFELRKRINEIHMRWGIFSPGVSPERARENLASSLIAVPLQAQSPRGSILQSKDGRTETSLFFRDFEEGAFIVSPFPEATMGQILRGDAGTDATTIWKAQIVGPSGFSISITVKDRNDILVAEGNTIGFGQPIIRLGGKTLVGPFWIGDRYQAILGLWKGDSILSSGFNILSRNREGLFDTP